MKRQDISMFRRPRWMVRERRFTLVFLLALVQLVGVNQNIVVADTVSDAIRNVSAMIRMYEGMHWWEGQRNADLELEVLMYEMNDEFGTEDWTYPLWHVEEGAVCLRTAVRHIQLAKENRNAASFAYLRGENEEAMEFVADATRHLTVFVDISIEIAELHDDLAEAYIENTLGLD